MPLLNLLLDNPITPTNHFLTNISSYLYSLHIQPGPFMNGNTLIVVGVPESMEGEEHSHFMNDARLTGILAGMLMQNGGLWATRY